MGATFLKNKILPIKPCVLAKRKMIMLLSPIFSNSCFGGLLRNLPLTLEVEEWVPPSCVVNHPSVFLFSSLKVFFATSKIKQDKQCKFSRMKQWYRPTIYMMRLVHS